MIMLNIVIFIPRKESTDMTTSTQQTLVHTDISGAVAHIRLTRARKRNALNDAIMQALQAAFVALPDHVRAVVLDGEGEHFCAGLDLSQVLDHSATDGFLQSRSWHRIFFDHIKFGKVPVISVLHGAVVGGGLELACATHLRVAEESTFYALPEGQRGIFVGGSGTVTISEIIGLARMTDMILTGRVLTATEGQQIGLSQYLVANGRGLDTAMELAERIASNAPMSNYAVMHALPRIAEMPMDHGLLLEGLMAGVTQSEQQAKRRVRGFLESGEGKVRPDRPHPAATAK